MTFIPFAPGSDDRRTKAMAPLILRNMMWEPAPEGSPKAGQWSLVNFPAPVRRYTGDAANPCRGIFAAPGVQDGALFAVLGLNLYKVASDYSLTSIGSIAGADRIVWGFMRDKLLILGGGFLYQWDGSSFTKVTDSDFPANVFTLTMQDQRAIVSAAGGDTYWWSNVLDATSYASLAFATSERLPDEIIATGTNGGDLWLFGSKGTEVLNGGGDVSAPFTAIRSVTINKGCAARDSLTLIQGSFFFVGDDRVVYRTDTYSPISLPNRYLEKALSDLTTTEIANCVGFQAQFGSRLFYVLRLPSDRAFVYDIGMGAWTSELTTWNEDAYKIAFTAQAYGKTFCAGPDDGDIFTYEADVYDDNDVTIEKIASFAVPLSGRAIIKNLAIDMTTYDAPLSGQGSSPEAMIEYWKEAGRFQSGAAGAVRTVRLPAQGETKRFPNVRRLGLCNAQNGLVVQVKVTDPVGLNMAGVRVNEGAV